MQANIQGHSTQTSNILNVEKSDSTDLLSVTNVNGTHIRGSTTNDAAAAGMVGEYIESIQTVLQPTAATTQWAVITSITLTAGDWDISGSWWVEPSGAAVTSVQGCISTDSGNNANGVTFGLNGHNIAPASSTDMSMNQAPYRVSLSGSQQYWLKFRGSYTASDIDGKGFIAARRVR